MIVRKCDYCETEYTARSTRGKTCSRRCSDRLYNSIRRNKGDRKYYRVCIDCNSDFETSSGSRVRCNQCSTSKKDNRLLFKELTISVNDTKKAISDAIDNLNTLMQMMRDLRVCALCNKEYCKESTGGTKYCSKLCSTKASNIQKNSKRININKDKRLSKNGKADYSISLDRLIERDGMGCHICGGLTNKEDKYIHSDGKTVICGNNYPSIDHVIPISKGGLHQWDNIKLSHRVCNSKKNNKII